MDSRDAGMRWIRDVANGGLTFRGGRPYGYRSSALYATSQGRLSYWRREGYRRRAWGPVDIAAWAPEGRVFVLNGDGFTDQHATRWQTNTRNWVLTTLGHPIDRTGNVRAGWGVPGMLYAERCSYAIIPFMALNAAGIIAESVRTIHVENDRWETVRHHVPAPPPRSKFAAEPNFDDRGGRITRRPLFATHQGRRYQTFDTLRHVWYHRTTGQRSTNHPPWRENDNWRTEREWVPLDQYNVDMAGVRQPGGFKGLDVRNGRWGWTEEIHHLGAAVFSSIDASGRRRRFLSAFDEDEPNPMYFLAQLPNRGRIETYEQAVHALAPPIVHQAREKGIPVYRQGDVFAIETDRTDEWIYANARTRVRREVATYDPGASTVRRLDEVPQMDERDFTEKAPCQCCGHTARIGWGPRCRRALMIYGTAHTATEVAVVAGGAVYIRGTMFHDPHLEEPGRRPEHVTINLGEENRWHLAVRNTVPRRRSQTTDSNQPQEVTPA